MSADFSPRQCWYVNKDLPGLYLSNIKFTYKGKETWMFTEEELEDRRKHKYIAICGVDVYKRVQECLSKTEFEEFNNLLGRIIKADESNGDMSGFPEEVIDWYFNRHKHHYREPNDEELIEYLKQCH